MKNQSPLEKDRLPLWLRKVLRRLHPVPHYVSDVWWHFTGYRKTDEDAFALVDKILRSGHIRSGTSQINMSQRGQIGVLQGGTPTSFYEGPRSCVGDIPLENLRIHGRRYGTVGFGFSSEILRSNSSIEINPVLYADYHLQNQIRPVINQTGVPSFDLVKPFIKVCDDAEDFGEIYLEREWRSRSNIPVTKDTLLHVMVPSRFRAQTAALLKAMKFSDATVLVWEDEVGALPERDFI